MRPLKEGGPHLRGPPASAALRSSVLAPIFAGKLLYPRMILTCPSCATRYQADEAKFPAAGRQVRCAKCGHVWHQGPLAPEEQVAETPEPVIAAPEQTPAS